MKRFFFLLVAASVFLCTRSEAARRPRYGGTLRIEVSAARPALNAELLNSENAAAKQIAPLICETLVKVSRHDELRPALAVNWKSEQNFSRWQFELRSNVRFPDGKALTAVDVAEALRRAGIEAVAKVSATGDQIFFQSTAPLPELPYLLAQERFAIAKTAGGNVVGTGPFQIAESGSGEKQLRLVANENYWSGRPYLDAVQLSFGVPLRQQLYDVELGNADVAELPAEQAPQAVQQNLRISASQPMELLALIFDPSRPAVRRTEVRDALAAAIDRESIWSALLQKSGVPSAALLPQWMTGYSFLFSPQASPEKQNGAVENRSPLLLEYDFSDPLMKTVAERIAVDAMAEGIGVQAVGEPFPPAPGRADCYLAKLPINDSDPRQALLDLLQARRVFDPQLHWDTSAIWSSREPQQLFQLEKSFLAERMMVPIAYLPLVQVLGSRIHDWPAPALNRWPLADVWMENAAQGTHP